MGTSVGGGNSAVWPLGRHSEPVDYHGGDSIDTTCAVVRDVTAYIAVVRVFRFPSEYYGCRYTNSTHVKAAHDCI